MSKQPGLNQVNTVLRLFLEIQEKSHMKGYTCARIAQILYSDQRWDVMPSLGLCGISDYLHTTLTYGFSRACCFTCVFDI
jgi:hypothetical protein